MSSARHRPGLDLLEQALLDSVSQPLRAAWDEAIFRAAKSVAETAPHEQEGRITAVLQALSGYRSCVELDSPESERGDALVAISAEVEAFVAQLGVTIDALAWEKDFKSEPEKRTIDAVKAIHAEAHVALTRWQASVRLFDVELAAPEHAPAPAPAPAPEPAPTPEPTPAPAPAPSPGPEAEALPETEPPPELSRSDEWPNDDWDLGDW